MPTVTPRARVILQAAKRRMRAAYRAVAEQPAPEALDEVPNQHLRRKVAVVYDCEREGHEQAKIYDGRRASEVECGGGLGDGFVLTTAVVLSASVFADSPSSVKTSDTFFSASAAQATSRPGAKGREVSSQSSFGPRSRRLPSAATSGKPSAVSG